MSAFATSAISFEAFLTRVKDSLSLTSGSIGAPQNSRFIPRNFLLEERLDPLRITSYEAKLATASLADFAEWNAVHNEYLKEHVFVIPPTIHDYRFITPDNVLICPETFRAALALSAFQGTDLDTNFIRLIPVRDLAWLSGENEDRIFSLGEQVISDTRVDNPARFELSIILENAFTSGDCQHRPIFAGFYEDFVDDLHDLEWANRLRDRLGLYHVNPCRVFLFRYSVRELPRFIGDPDNRPIAIPVVIDHRLSEAFCPAPRELDKGRTLNLKANSMDEPAREVLHLFMPMQVEHLFRVGQVTTPIPYDLAEARRDHLIWMRLQATRDDYASDTDADLF